MKTIFVLISILILTITVNSHTITFTDSDGLGRQFEGIGGISGGGATSKLLVNYPQKQRDEILDFLFKPNFGASLQILKVEIGGDVQSTDGTEASHMHNAWEENYHRGYEWWLMGEAKKRNPGIKLYALPWGFPGWIGQGHRSPYTNVKVLADYVVRWVIGAKVHHNLTLDYIGIWNEKHYNVEYIKTLRATLDLNGFNHTLIIAADEKWEIARDISADPQLADVVHAIGCHYPGTSSTPDAQKTKKPLWASEDYSTYNDDIGGGCWARILNQNYVNGYMTSTISWNLIASYYKGLPFYRDGLMTATEPWSGNYVVNSPIWMTAHTTQFVSPGWHYLPHMQGVTHLPKGGSLVSLTSQGELTMVIETMTHEHSKCIRPALLPYIVQPQNITLSLGGSFINITQLNVWYSKLGSNEVLFKNRGVIKGTKVDGGYHQFNLTLGLDEVFTLTTLTSGQKGDAPVAPAPRPFPLPYEDNFDKYPEFSEPFMLTPQAGSWEILNTSDAIHGQVAQQTVIAAPITWCPIIGDTLNTPFALIGDITWTDIYASIEFRLSPLKGSSGAFIAARMDEGGCTAFLAHGIFFFAFQDRFILANDLARTKVIKEGTLWKPFELGEWHKLSLTILNGTITAGFDDYYFVRTEMPKRPYNGFVAIGTDNFGLVDFDNLVIDHAKEHLQHGNFKSQDFQDSPRVIVN